LLLPGAVLLMRGLSSGWWLPDRMGCAQLGMIQINTHDRQQ
jgi:hypothetical protein